MKFTPEQKPIREADMGDPKHISDTLAYIEHIKTMLAAWGNVANSEYETLNQLAEALTNGRISPTEATEKADQLFESKNFR